MLFVKRSQFLTMTKLISKPTFSTMIRSPTWMPLLFTFTVPAERDKKKIRLMNFKKKKSVIIVDAYNDHFKHLKTRLYYLSANSNAQTLKIP